MKYVITPLILILSLQAHPKKDERGLLPEIKPSANNESESEKNVLSSEILITKTETKAIESLQNILKRKKGSADEPDLWYRLAELYQRRSKSGRFFDLYINEKTKRLSSVPAAAGKSSNWVKKSITIYNKIQNEFKNYRDMDSVLFNNAFAHQQIGQLKVAETLYIKLIETKSKSSLMPDALLALSELFYDQGKFASALNYFEKLEQYKESRLYSYGLYKMAWTYYNMRNTQMGIKKLDEVLKLNPPLQAGEPFTKGHYLRKEALRDLTIFIGDTYSASELYSFFKKRTAGDELGTAMLDLGKLYESHSRHKEMNSFLNEFIKDESDNSGVVKAHLMLVEANESLKSRDDVVSHLQTASQLCKSGTKWRLKQTAETIEESCSKEFRQTSLDIAAKWWEIWIKNKKHVGFSELTEKAFRIILDNEDIEKPDLKTRYALAELLFQLNKFEEASDHYKIVGDKSTDPVMGHDATYGALYAKEKSYEKEKSNLKEAQLKDLALNYVKKFPQGQHFLPVKFKVGLIYYEEKNYDESLKWLMPISENKTNRELAIKSEDMILDIYNIRKDFASIKKLTPELSKKSNDEKRKASLEKINEEAHYSEIQDFSKSSSDQLAAAEKLIEFYKTHPNSKLSQTSMWQSLSKLFEIGHNIRASEILLEYNTKYPKDEKNQDALKEAAKSFADSGRLLRAAAILTSFADKEPKNKLKYLETAADFYILENKNPEARKIFNSLLLQADKKDRARIFNKILSTFNGKTNDPEYQKVENTILNQNIEPYATQILNAKAEQLLKQKKFKESFELARKILSRDSSSEDRAPARLVQAEVLEQELVSQSVKSSKEDRLVMVLAMKTEKLEKAQTAYLSATKMDSDAKTQLLAFQGVDRCYQNYISSLKSITPPPTLSLEEQKLLLDEIAKVVGPIEEKRVENLKQIQAIARNALSKEHQIVWTDLSVESTAKPPVRYPDPNLLSAYFPKNFTQVSNSPRPVEFKANKSCDLKKWKNNGKENNTVDIVESCYSAQDMKTLEKIAMELTMTKSQKNSGIYLLSYVSESQSLNLKAYWLIEKYLAENPADIVALYHKARLAYKIDGLNNALPLFSQVLNSSMSSTEIETFKGIKAYTENNFETVIQIFSSFPKDKLYTMNMGLLLSEAYAQKGDLAKSLKTVADFLNSKPQDVLFGYIHQAHVLEMYKNSSIEALDSYQKALRLAKEDDMKAWIEKKIEYLKSLNKKVGLNATGGEKK